MAVIIFTSTAKIREFAVKKKRLIIIMPIFKPRIREFYLDP